MTHPLTEALTSLTFLPTKKKAKCEYCKGSGFEIQPVRYADIYGENSAPVDVAVPCRVCQGKKASYERETRARLNLPYDAFMAAFNPMAYKDANGNVVSFQKEYSFIMGFIEKFKTIQKESDINGLYFYSSTGGTGKTFLASIVCNEIYSRHQLMPLYTTENGLLDELSKETTINQERQKERYQKAQILFIDDMWRKRTGRDWLIDELFNIIDYRYNKHLCTIITSNVSMRSQGIDKRIASRLNDMCAEVHLPEIEIRSLSKPDKNKTLMGIINGKEKNENT